MTTALGRGTTGYRDDVEWKGKLILWRAHDISNTSRGPSPPTPTKSSDEGNLLQNCCGTAESCRSITLRERREPTDLFGSERLRRLQFDGDVYEAH